MINMVLVMATCISLFLSPIVATCIALFMGVVTMLIIISYDKTEIQLSFISAAIWYFTCVGFVLLMVILPTALEVKSV